MSQRNPMNERYTSDERSGKTRKSAASAKPTSKAASSVHVSSGKQTEKPKGLFARARNDAGKDAGAKASEKAKKRAAQEERFAYHDPDNEEYKKWRRIWWICIAGAIALTALSMYLLNAVGSQAGIVTLIGGYILLGASLFIDIKKVRKIRDQSYAAARGDRSKQATKTRKQQKAELKAREAQMVAEAEAKEAEREAKRAAKGAKRSKVLEAATKKVAAASAGSANAGSANAGSAGASSANAGSADGDAAENNAKEA